MPTYYDPVTGKPIREEKTYYDPETAKPVSKREVTILTPLEEPRFRAWARQSGIDNIEDPEQDYRGIYKKNNGKPLTLGRSLADAARARLVAQGTTPERVKERAAAGKPIVESGGQRIGTGGERAAAHTMAGVAGLAENVGGTTALGWDILGLVSGVTPVQMGVKKLFGRDVGMRDVMPATSAVTEAADEIERGRLFGGDLKLNEIASNAPVTRTVSSLLPIGPEGAAIAIATKLGSKAGALGARAATTVADDLTRATAQTVPDVTDALRPANANAERLMNPPQAPRIGDAEAEELARQAGEAQGRLASADPSRYVETSGVEVTSRPQAAEPFDSDAYVREELAKMEAARKKNVLTGMARAKQVVGKLKADVVDTMSPIEDRISAALRAEGREVLPSENVRNAYDRVIMSDTIAGQFAKDNGLEAVIREVPDADKFSVYLKARHAPEIEAEGFTTGRDLARDAEFVKANEAVFEPYAKQVDSFARKLLDYRVKSGLVSPEYADYVNATYPNYVPFERIFSEAEVVPFTGRGSGKASISGQSTDLKLVGSTREVEDPLRGLLEKTAKSFQQGELNKAAELTVASHTIPGNPLGLRPQRLADDVRERVAITKELSIFGREQNKLRRVAAATGRNLTATNQILGRQFDRINRSIAKTADESQAIYDAMTVHAADFETNSAVDGLLQQSKAAEQRIAALQQRAHTISKDLHDLVFSRDANPATMATRGLEKERRLFELQGRREQLDFGPTAERRTQLQETLDALKLAVSERSANVKSLREELIRLRDAPKGVTDQTISYLNKGVRETWITDIPEVAAAAKSLHVQQLPPLLQMMAIPVRISKTMMTGINLAFLAKNPAKDIPTAVINSKAGEAVLAHIPRGIFEAVGHGKFYDELMREGGMFTSFDQYRNAPELSVAEIRSHRSKLERAKYLITKPSELLRAAENIAGRSEQVMRIAGASAEYSRAIKAGMSPEEAMISAKEAALWNTGPFHRHGDAAPLIRAMTLYLNASIQGQRVGLSAWKARPVATLRKTLIFPAFAVMSAMAWNLRDPKRKEVYDQIKPFEKENNIIIVPNDATRDEKTGLWNVYKIPMQPNLAKVAALVRRPMESAADLDPVRFGEVAGYVLGVVSPVSSTDEAISNTMIHAAKPLVEVGINRNTFTKHDIVPRYLQDKPPEEQVFDNTSGFARLVAKPIGTSPLNVQHLMRGYGGGVGMQALNLADRGLAAAGAIPPEQIGGEDPLSMARRGYYGAYGMTDRELEERDARRREAIPLDPAQQEYLRKLMGQSPGRVHRGYSDPDRERAVLEMSPSEMVPPALRYRDRAAELTAEGRTPLAKTGYSGRSSSPAQTEVTGPVSLPGYPDLGPEEGADYLHNRNTIRLGNKSQTSDAWVYPHEIGHAIWVKTLPDQIKSQWAHIHRQEVRRGVASGPVAAYPDEPSHSFVEAFAEYVMDPETLESESPRLYRWLYSVIGREYKELDAAEAQNPAAQVPFYLGSQ